MVKRNKRGSGKKFVQIDDWLMQSVAWQEMKPGPRMLYIELKRRFNGGNNGRIFLSHRDAATALKVGRDTVSGYFGVLIKHGFIAITRGHCLGPAGIGQSSHYRLTEMPHEGAPATKEFMTWTPNKEQKPRKKTQHSMVGKTATPSRKIQPSKFQRSENPASFVQNRASIELENPAIYTSSHITSPTWKVSEKKVLCGLGLCGKAVSGIRERELEDRQSD